MKKEKLTKLYAVTDDTFLGETKRKIEFIFKTEEEAERYASWINKEESCNDYHVVELFLLENWEVEE